MRIVHICQRDDPATGGALRVAEALVKEQSACGLDVSILFLYGPPATVSAKLEDKQVICLGLSSSRQALRGITLLRKTISDLSPDIIHSHDGIVWPRLALLRIGIPHVMHTHLPAWNPRTIGQRIGWTLINRTTDFLIGISHHTIQSWVQSGYPKEKIRYVPNGVDFKRFRMIGTEEKVELRRHLGLPESKRILLWIGQMHRSMKGTDRMEHVASRLPEDTVLLVVGGGPEFVSVQGRCKPLLESGRMRMTGTVQEPASYYMASDAFMFTSYHEPFGLVILEAVSSGLPIMAFPLTQGGGATDLLREFQAVQINDGASGQEIEQVLQELTAGKMHAAAHRNSAEAKYDWRKLSDEVVSVYRSILLDHSLRIIVCQHGARHRYAIPRMLEAAGCLEAFYTDTSAVSLLGKSARILDFIGIIRKNKSARWNVHGLPRNKVYSSDMYHIHELIQTLVRTKKEGIFLYEQRHRHLSSRMKRWGLKNANMVYSMYHEDLDFIRWAKQQGARSVIDVFISPVTDQILEQEASNYPAWVVSSDIESTTLEKQLWIDATVLADLLLCPSEWVAEGVRTVSPEDADKIRVVPYGCSIDYAGRVNIPVPGRILFAGREPLRKGLHYLAQAATRLAGSMPGLDIRVAGEMPLSVVNDPLCRDLNFIGQLDSQQMQEEYLTADALILPALSEGFAGVVAEAVAGGCPVIVTKEAGSPIIHEREGLIVPSRDIDALAEAIQRMVSDREFRNRCSENCLKQKSFYSEQQWKERLLEALRDVVDL